MIEETQVLEVLSSANKPIKAREVATMLSTRLRTMVSRTDANKVLYQLKTKGRASIDDQFKWSIIEKTNDSSNNARKEVTANPPTHYEILQVTPSAHREVIMKAYKALVNLYHPDRAPDTKRETVEERMKLINVAYEILSDERKRAEYDKKLSHE